MQPRHTSFVLIPFVLIALLYFVLAGAEAPSTRGAEAIEPIPATAPLRACSDCHICLKPTKEAPCLAPCPRVALGHGPDVVLIDQLSNQYVPVIFAHKLHAQMTEMTGGCTLCHHFNPSQKIVRCRECHSVSGAEDFQKPGLKGAYHRQCLNCHREWSHKTECAVCHARKTLDSPPVRMPDPTDIMGILHPNAEEPIVKKYETKHEPGRLVTFRHQDHVKRFGFKCVSCHQVDSCSRCHKPDTPTVRSKTFVEHHSPCSACHETRKEKTESCIHCHSDREIPPFSHEKTGLALDDRHKDANCTDCHRNSQFGRKPDCSECHELAEKITYPEKLPGKKVAKP